MSEQTKFKTAYSDDDYRVRKHFPNPSLAKQSFAAEADINNIMSRYAKTGIIEHLQKYEGQYGQFEDVQPYHQSLNQVMAAQRAFEDLPSKVRAAFQNDPGAFLAYATDPANAEGMVELGLAHAPAAPDTPIHASQPIVPADATEAPAAPKTPPPAE